MATTTTTQGTSQSNDALSVLLQQLLNGGTEEQQRQLAARLAEVNQVNAQRARYTPEAAFADAQGLMSQMLRQAMEGSVAQLTRGAEGAGTSAGSMRALMTQDALTRASEASAAAGLSAAQGYGQIGANLSGVLEALTRQDNSSIESILSTIQAMQNASQTQTTEGGATTVGGGRITTTGSGSSSGSVLGMPSTDNFFYRNGGILSDAAEQRKQSMQVYGPAATSMQIADTIQRGLSPSQALADVPNINELFTTGLRF